MTTKPHNLNDFPFLDELPEPWLERLAGLGSRVTYAAGHRLFHEGGRAERFWLITEGAIGVDLPVPRHGDVLLETLPPGSVLGWSWLFPPYRWHFGAIAVRTTQAIEFRGADVLALCREDPALGMELMQRFMGVVVQRLHATRVRLLEFYGFPAGDGVTAAR
jgi:CRP-like cAMP-binding protein